MRRIQHALIIACALAPGHACSSAPTASCTKGAVGCPCDHGKCTSGRCISGLCVDLDGDTDIDIDDTFGGEVTTSSSSSSSSSSETSGACITTFEIDAFAQVSELEIGATERYDMDGDGLLDIVGGRGFVVSADLEVAPFAEVVTTLDGHAGMFDGDDVPDMAWGRAPDEGFIVYPGAGGDPITTATPRVRYFAAIDLDDDGIDDLALSGDNGAEVWLGSAGGAFTKLTDVGTGVVALSAFMHRPTGIDLVLGDDASTSFEVYGFDGSAFTSTSSFELLQAYFLESVDPFAADVDYLLVTESWTQLTTMSSVGLLYPDGDSWSSFTVDFDGHTPWNAAVGDLDDDGIDEIAVASDDSLLSLLCWTGDGLAHCGERDDLPGLQVELMPGRVLAAGDGVWVAEVTPLACR